MKFILGILILALDIWAVVNVLKSTSGGGAKALWLLGIIFFPVAGFIVWLLAGPKDTKRLPGR